jgi:hypothetical protein
LFILLGGHRSFNLGIIGLQAIKKVVEYIKEIFEFKINVVLFATKLLFFFIFKRILRVLMRNFCWFLRVLRVFEGFS